MSVTVNDSRLEKRDVSLRPGTAGHEDSDHLVQFYSTTRG